MALIKSISGIRGTIGGKPYENLTPVDIVNFIAAYSLFLKKNTSKPKIILGRDARISGYMIKQLVLGTLIANGINIIDIDLATTPTVEMAVILEKADGGIIITASHNPMEWNALKLLNNKGEFLNKEEANEVIALSEKINNIDFSNVFELGKIKKNESYHLRHIEEILKITFVETALIRDKKFKVVIDCINSVGAIAIPSLLENLGVDDVIKVNCEANGLFAHNPEPLEKNLSEIMSLVKKHNADVGFVVDPDVDRLAIISEDGSYFGEEYTLVAIADYILKHKPGNTVSNISSSMALKHITEKYGGKYFYSAVGEINVVEKMKEVNAVIGGEGNGGVIYPALHYGRDALVGIALFLSFMAKYNLKPSEIRSQLPAYYMAKTKINISDIDFNSLIIRLKQIYPKAEIITIDGIKIQLADSWVLIRKSNTEPIIRIYAEGKSKQIAADLVKSVEQVIIPNDYQDA